MDFRLRFHFFAVERRVILPVSIQNYTIFYFLCQEFFYFFNFILHFFSVSDIIMWKKHEGSDGNAVAAMHFGGVLAFPPCRLQPIKQIPDSGNGLP